MKKIEKTIYMVEIPTILTNMVGTQNIRGALERATILIFEDWARTELLNKIRVTKPRSKDNHEGENTD